MSTPTCGSTILKGRPLRTFGKGRVCAHPACGTIISQYNSAPFCCQHESLYPAKFDIESLLFKTKHCPLCDRDLPASADYWHRDSKEEDGLSNLCAKCRQDGQKLRTRPRAAEYQRERYANDPAYREMKRKAERDRRARLRGDAA